MRSGRTTRRLRLLLGLLAALAHGAPVAARADAVPPSSLSEAERKELAAIEFAEAPIHDLEERAEEHERRRNTYRVTRRIARYGEAAVETIEEKEPERGMELLNRLNMNRLNPFERANIYQVRAFVAYELGKTDEAIENFEKVLEQEVMDLDAEDRLRYNIAQLRASQQDWPGAIRALRRWSEYVREKPAEAYYLMAIAQYQVENVDASIRYAEEALERAEQPKEGWLQLLASLYIQKEDYQAARPLLEQLLVNFPKKAYWNQLALIYGAVGEYERSLAVQQLAYTQGLITEDEELQRLARSYLYANMPYEAAKVLRKGLDEGVIEPAPEAYELLANSWIAAREYDESLPPLQKAAALSETGDLYVRIGQVHMQREEWGEATEMFRKALEKGDLEDEGQALLLLGISHFNAEQIGQARSYFARARRYDDSRAEADRWIKHIDEAEGPGSGAAANPT